jgi:hypothetical protein
MNAARYAWRGQSVEANNSDQSQARLNIAEMRPIMTCWARTGRFGDGG